jgi:hypothetical protein
MIFIGIISYLFIGFISTWILANYDRLPGIDNPFQTVFLFILWPIFLIKSLQNKPTKNKKS